MKQYVERYIYAVTRRLKESSRDEVSQELSAHIYDMLPENPTDEEVEQVLKSLGSPRKLANNYQTDQHYVISPLYFYDYIKTLKIVFIILFSIQIVFGTIESILDLSSTNIIEQIFEVFFHTIGEAFTGLYVAFTWVTLIFWMIDYGMRKKGDEWSIKDLPDLPKPQTNRISRVETMVGLIFHVVFSAVFIALFLNHTEALVIRIDGVFITGIFNPDQITPFIPYFIGSAIFGLIVALFKLYIGQWRLNLTILHTAYEILSSSLLILFIRTNGLIKNAVYETIATHTDYTYQEVLDGFNRGINITTWVILAILAIDLIFTWIKTLKVSNQT